MRQPDDHDTNEEIIHLLQLDLEKKDAEIARLEADVAVLKSTLQSDEEQLRIQKDKTLGAVKTAMDYLSDIDQLRARLAEAESKLAAIEAGYDVQNLSVSSQFVLNCEDSQNEQLAKQLALESQCQRMKDALTAKINGDDPEDYFNIQFPPTSGVGPALEWFATLRAAGKTPLDLELLNRVCSILAAVQDSEFGGIECKDVNGQNWFDARDAILKSLSPSPNPAK